MLDRHSSQWQNKADFQKCLKCFHLGFIDGTKLVSFLLNLKNILANVFNRLKCNSMRMKNTQTEGKCCCVGETCFVLFQMCLLLLFCQRHTNLSPSECTIFCKKEHLLTSFLLLLMEHLYQIQKYLLQTIDGISNHNTKIAGNLKKN